MLPFLCCPNSVLKWKLVTSVLCFYVALFMDMKIHCASIMMSQIHQKILHWINHPTILIYCTLHEKYFYMHWSDFFSIPMLPAGCKKMILDICIFFPSNSEKCSSKYSHLSVQCWALFLFKPYGLQCSNMWWLEGHCNLILIS